MLRNFLKETQRRKVFPVLASYAIAGWVIVQVFSIIPQAIGLPDWTLTLVSVLYLAFFPVVIFVSWYFDLSLDGLSLTPAKGQTEATKVGKVYWFAFSIMLVLSSGLGVFGYQYALSTLEAKGSSVRATSIGQSIAVLPFRDASAESDQSYLALGLQEEISNKLATFAGLKVASTYSTTALFEKYSDINVIAERLSVATVLTGSVRVNGDRLRVRVELLLADTLEVLWSQTFTRELLDFFAIEEEISRSVVNLLQDKMLSKGDVFIASKTENSLALALYLQAKEKLRLRTSESIMESRKLFEQTLAIDSEYANARVGLAQTYLLLSKGHNSFGSLEPEIAARLAKENIDIVLPRYPELADAHATMGRILAYGAEHEKALEYYDKAIALNPNYSTAYVWKYLSLESLQRNSEAFESLAKAYELDPAYLLVIHNYARANFQIGKVEKAKTLFSEILELHEDSPLAHRGFAELAFLRGDLVETAVQYKKALEKSPSSDSYKTSLLSVLFQVGAVDVAKQYIDNDEWNVNILLAEGKYDEANALMQEKLALYPDEKWYLYEAAWYQYLYGDVQVGKSLLIQAESLFQEYELFLAPLCNPAMEIAYAFYLDSQKEEQLTLINGCEALLKSSISSGRESEASDYLNARLAALNNDSELAIQKLKQAYEGGWREHWTQHDPLLSSIREDEEVQLIFKKIQQDLEAAKQAIRQEFLH